MSRAGRTFRAALLAPANVVGLATAGGAALLTGHWLPALVALGAEAFYLAAVGLVPSLRRAVGSRAGRPEDDEAERLLSELAESQRDHYFVLRELRDSILENYRKLPGGGVLAASSEAQLAALLTAFLRLLSTLNDHRRYLGIADREALRRELTLLESELGSQDNLRLREVQEKRADILRRRLERFAQAEESREVVSHQLASIEDLVKLTHEQSISIRDPAAVTGMLDALAAEVSETEKTVRELEQFLDLTEEPVASTGRRARVRG
ncbi:MAG TPA: hypothetical protein VLT82_17530 [Myxococcaceae bacterium]|nr:hypothetical protein [Myxococcaceae bacterium]